MNLELRLWMEHHKMICPHCKVNIGIIGGDYLDHADILYWHFDGYCKAVSAEELRAIHKALAATV